MLSEEEPAERASRPVPVIEDIDGEEAADSVRAAPMRDEPIAEPDSPDDDADLEDSADDNSTVDQDEPADREGQVADEPFSERDALKLVRAADRELARAIEQCVGRADLVAELQRARIRVAAGVRRSIVWPGGGAWAVGASEGAWVLRWRMDGQKSAGGRERGRRQ